MNKEQFKKSLIEMVSLGYNTEKDDIITLLKITNIAFEKTMELANKGVWNQHCENIHFKITEDKLIKLKSYTKYLEELCYDMYPVNNEYALCNVFIESEDFSGNLESIEESFFKNIQGQIIDEIRKAKYLIFIVMTWFTEPILYNELLKKKEQGLVIEIIVDDNQINRNVEFKLEADFPIHWVEIHSLNKDIIYDKFCIIDLQTVIYGTFNCTKVVNYNKETIIVNNSRKVTEVFADEFIKIRRA